MNKNLKIILRSNLQFRDVTHMTQDETNVETDSCISALLPSVRDSGKRHNHNLNHDFVSMIDSQNVSLK